jgi:tripartite ATP-independent transporter DctP family solute receptor
MKLAKLSVTLGVALAALGLSPAAAIAQQPVTIRLGHVGFPGSLFDIAGNKFAQDVNQALKGRVEVRVFHSSQLGSDEQMIKGIRVGAPEMQIPSTVMSTVDQRYGVFEMPYLIVNRAHMKKAAENREVQKALFEPLPAKGLRVLGVWENGFRHITNNVRPIVRPEDLKGIKLRVPGGVWRVKMFQAYGANPSPMPFAEVYSALQSGVMDAQENPFTQICRRSSTRCRNFSRSRAMSTRPPTSSSARTSGSGCPRTSRTRSQKSPGRRVTSPVPRVSGWTANCSPSSRRP